MADDSNTDAGTADGIISTDQAAPDLGLGDAGKKALDLMKAERGAAQRDAKAAAKERDALKAELDKAREASQTDQDKALDQARKEADKTARDEVTARFTAALVRANVLAAAGGRLADPSDAVRLIDLDQFVLNDSLDVDRDAATKAVDDLIAAKPYLAAEPTSSGQSRRPTEQLRPGAAPAQAPLAGRRPSQLTGAEVFGSLNT